MNSEVIRQTNTADLQAKYPDAENKQASSYQLFPSNAKFNFYYYTHQATKVTFGSVMNAMTTTIEVGYFQPPTDDEMFFNTWCTTCEYMDATCLGGLDRFMSGDCVHSIRRVGEWTSSEVTMELPELVLLKRRGTFNLLTYEPKSAHPHKPLNVFNVYEDSRICWGDQLEPKTLREAWSVFWTSKFNYDLTKFHFKYNNYLDKETILYSIEDICGVSYELLELTPENILEPCHAAVVQTVDKEKPVRVVIPAIQEGNRLYYKYSNDWFYHLIETT